MEPVEPDQTNINQSNTYRKDLSWLHLDNEQRDQERQQVKDQQSKISIFAAHLTIPSISQEHISMSVRYICRDTEQSQEKETLYNKSRLQFSWRQF